MVYTNVSPKSVEIAVYSVLTVNSFAQLLCNTTQDFLQVSEVKLIGHQPYNAYLSPSSISFLFLPEFFKVSEVTERELNFYFDK